MKKKVLVLSASPRKGGNSDYLCDEFIRGAREAGHQVEKIYYQDKKIGYCMGCGACYDSGVCVQDDDMVQVLDKMLAADAVVFATPVYFYSMNAQLKTLIDRTLPRYSDLRGRYFLIATLADRNINTLMGIVAPFRGFLSCLDHAEEGGMIFGLGAWQMGDIVGNDAIEEAYHAGLNCLE